MKKYRVRVEVSMDSNFFTVSPDDMGYDNDEWEAMSEDQQQAEIQKYADDMPDQPYWVVDTYEEV